MVLAAGTWQRGAQFAVTKCAAERGNSTDDPEHEQGEARLNVNDLKSETGKNAGADDVCDHDSAGGKKTDGARRSSQVRRGRVGGMVHVWRDNGIVRQIRQLIEQSLLSEARTRVMVNVA